ncbi:hypothetical protein [Pacificoceanicola onchidii]|uniref:hypothetical protein n=1 Tax=Pacificoceanicola onchidii TaxID=2562685 RepID=UPI0010A323AF|nr:hypothetical protein [Pacificoceanicola onchidii]
MSGLPPRAAFVASCSALALSRGGLVESAPLVCAVSDALKVLPRGGGRLGPLFGPAGDVITAQLRADEEAFAAGRYALFTAVHGYWRDMALGKGA